MNLINFCLAPFAFAFAVTAAQAQSETLHTGILTEQGPDRYLAHDNLIGVKVHDDGDVIVGDIEDLIIDSTNRVVGVVVGTGGVLGIGEKRVGVRLTSLDFEENDGTTHAVLSDISKADLESAPAFERRKAAKSLLQRAKEKAKELTDKTAATSQRAYEKAKPSIETAKESMKQTYEKAKDAAKPAIDAAKEAVTPNPSEN